MVRSWCWLGFDQLSLPLPLGLSRNLTQPSATKTKDYRRHRINLAGWEIQLHVTADHCLSPVKMKNDLFRKIASDRKYSISTLAPQLTARCEEWRMWESIHPLTEGYKNVEWKSAAFPYFDKKHPEKCVTKLARCSAHLWHLWCIVHYVPETGETVYFPLTPHEISEERGPNLPLFFVGKSFSANREPSVPSTAATSLHRGDYLC